MNSTTLVRRLSTVFRVAFLAGAFLIVCPGPAFAQAPAPAPIPGEAPAADTKEAKPVAHKKTLWQSLKQGGVVMPFIGAASVFVVYLVIDAFLRTAPNKLFPEAEVEKARQLFMAGDYVTCYQVMKATPCSFNNCVKYALAFIGKGKEQAEEAMLVEVGRESLFKEAVHHQDHAALHGRRRRSLPANLPSL